MQRKVHQKSKRCKFDSEIFAEPFVTNLHHFSRKVRVLKFEAFALWDSKSQGRSSLLGNSLEGQKAKLFLFLYVGCVIDSNWNPCRDICLIDSTAMQNKEQKGFVVRDDALTRRILMEVRFKKLKSPLRISLHTLLYTVDYRFASNTACNIWGFFVFV